MRNTLATGPTKLPGTRETVFADMDKRALSRERKEAVVERFAQSAGHFKRAVKTDFLGDGGAVLAKKSGNSLEGRPFGEFKFNVVSVVKS